MTSVADLVDSGSRGEAMLPRPFRVISHRAETPDTVTDAQGQTVVHLLGKNKALIQLAGDFLPNHQATQRVMQ